ncbi:MAG TPA: 3-hydroxyacyl-CoA dehydrogenase family protein [Desulfomonilaceae bacterium]|nr:3-hydroxyacyl-CoA dehydrogenase family protein [Desulfomonilaceae bacterium]
MGEDRAFKQIGVVGLGSMGCGIAQVVAGNGYQVRAVDVEKRLVDEAISRLDRAFQKLVQKNLMEEHERSEVLARIEGGTDLGVLKDCDLVIEAIYEDREGKRKLFSQLVQICTEETVFASNTSTLSITSLVSNLDRPERFLGLHFFNPAPVMKLVEVVKTAATSQEVLASVLDFVKSLGKAPVVVRDQAGFLVNYLLTPYLFDSIRSLSSGLASVNDIDTGMRLGCGHPMGPLALADLIGLDVLLNAGNILFDEYREARYAPPPLLKRLVALGDLGAKSGRGFYDYKGEEKSKPRDLMGL